MNIFSKIKNYLFDWFAIDDKVRFIIVGLGNTIIRYLIFVVLGLWFSIEHYQMILLASWVLSSLTAFLSYKILVFVTEGNHFKEYMKSVGIWTISYILNSLMLELMFKQMGMNVFLAQAIAIILLTVLNYMLFKYFAFKKEKKSVVAKVFSIFD